jgi:small subunit ribosomal protein S6e
MKIVISSKKGKAFLADLPKERERVLYGMKIGNVFEGAMLGAAGYKFRISGGSDRDGFPMRADLPGIGKTKLLLSGRPGFRPTRRGERQRKMVRGNIISEWIAQLNVVPTEEGPTPLDEIFKKAEGEKKEEKK